MDLLPHQPGLLGYLRTKATKLVAGEACAGSFPATPRGWRVASTHAPAARRPAPANPFSMASTHYGGKGHLTHRGTFLEARGLPSPSGRPSCRSPAFLLSSPSPIPAQQHPTRAQRSLPPSHCHGLNIAPPGQCQEHRVQGLGRLGNRRGTDAGERDWESREVGALGRAGSGPPNPGFPRPSLCTFLHHTHHLLILHTIDGIDFVSCLPSFKDSQHPKERESSLF